MSNRIPYDQATNTSKLMAQAVASMMETLQRFRRVRAILDRAQFGTPADWAGVVHELGLVDQPIAGGGTYTALQQAQEAYGVFGAAQDRLEHDAIRVELARLDQG